MVRVRERRGKQRRGSNNIEEKGREIKGEAETRRRRHTESF